MNRSVATRTAARLRQGLLALAALAVLATAVELAMLRHWNGYLQVIPWLALGVISVAIGLVAVRPSPGRVRIARVLAVAVLLCAGLGVIEHVLANHHAGPLDFRYATKWDSMSPTSQWWAAITETVGPSPSLAPLVLAWTALCVLFASIDVVEVPVASLG